MSTKYTILAMNLAFAIIQGTYLVISMYAEVFSHLACLFHLIFCSYFAYTAVFTFIENNRYERMMLSRLEFSRRLTESLERQWENLSNVNVNWQRDGF